jgi:hypothetical protein
VFPARYELNSYIVCRKRLVSKRLTSSLDEDPRPFRFTSGERALSTHFSGGWVGPRVGMGAVETGKILHCPESNPGLLGCRYTD